MMNGCFCLVFVAWTWQSKSPCCQLQLWCNRPRIRPDPTTGGMRATVPPRNSTAYVCVCVNIIPIPQQWYTESDLYDGSEKQNVRRGLKNHELRAQCNHKANMAVTWRGTMLLCTEQDGVWYPRTQVRRSPITQSWQERQIRAYPKNVNLPVLGQGNLPLNRLQLLSSEERGRKRKKDIWNQQLCGPYPRAADSVTPYSLYGTQLLHFTKTLTLFFLRQLSHSL